MSLSFQDAKNAHSIFYCHGEKRNSESAACLVFFCT